MQLNAHREASDAEALRDDVIDDDTTGRERVDPTESIGLLIWDLRSSLLEVLEIYKARICSKGITLLTLVAACFLMSVFLCGLLLASAFLIVNAANVAILESLELSAVSSAGVTAGLFIFTFAIALLFGRKFLLTKLQLPTRRSSSSA